MTPYRLSTGGLIDRKRPVSFTFDGKQYEGFAGDTLASALLANGVSLMGRSFKYHRPRGVMTAGAAEPNALMEIGTGGRREPNTRATMQEIYPDLHATSQNRWPSLDFDIGAANSLLSPFLSAGFYYKTFMWPKSFWEKVYEPFIRKAAGLGRIAEEADPDTYGKAWLHCDLLVAGSGPAGLAAALAAGRAGAKVVIVDEHAIAGGHLVDTREVVDGKSAQAFVEDAVAELRGLPNVTFKTRTTALAWYDDNVVALVERKQKHVAAPEANRAVEILWRVAAGHVIMATGAEERPLVFAGNDVPGVMLASAMRRYLNRFGVAVGRNIAIFTNNDSAYALAAEAEASGITVAAIIDTRSTAPSWTGRARVLTGSEIIATQGGKALKSVTVRTGAKEETLSVDALAMSGGFSPIVHLACQRQQKPVWNEDLQAFLAPDTNGALTPAGSVAGAYSSQQAFNDGADKAVEALTRLGFDAATPAADFADKTPGNPSGLWLPGDVKGKAFIDYQNDVHYKDIGLAVREGFDHVELAKRYTTNGMATDQGKLSNINAIALIARARGCSIAEVGTTTYRPFYTPVSFATLSGTHYGTHFAPVRSSPLHAWSLARGGEMVDAGLWYRPMYYKQAGDTDMMASINREVLAVRAGAGICDVSTLGKIEVTGPDAAKFLDLLYCNDFGKLAVGRARYGFMLREDGIPFDDGTTSRLGENVYFMTTTTAYAGPVLAHMEFCHQQHWPDLDVRFVSVSDQWAQMAIAGPRAREILASLVDEDISEEVFPFLSAKEVTLGSGVVNARLFRISFSGELAFEIAVPAGYGPSVADAIVAAGAIPYGVEALNTMRLEKGYITHAEMNGMVTVADLGFDRMVSRRKDDFVGKHMFGREGLVRENREQLVGVRALKAEDRFTAGAHVLKIGDQVSLENDQGYVTSSVWSPVVKGYIGLALVKGGRNRIGEKVRVWNALLGTDVEAVICSTDHLAEANGGKNA
ncbi:sarcosine oxidase subunit alpha family protein [Shinella sp. CPCC 101442]|uniref:sarcosine oxidase subunit alpha family protein n=1 Tax=Shinella sp. CPCC 101442 TaxID=2932265 RepID=UPI00215292FF|nr:sarcosine oxidase subunit alpha family protein [Shinella sp. CPCC 101442]MCR6498175.1 sarcosine oxidase subunit alpha family protein [Shinella sp. CPCC 101442]